MLPLSCCTKFSSSDKLHTFDVLNFLRNQIPLSKGHFYVPQSNDQQHLDGPNIDQFVTLTFGDRVSDMVVHKRVFVCVNQVRKTIAHRSCIPAQPVSSCYCSYIKVYMKAGQKVEYDLKLYVIICALSLYNV